MAFKEFSPTDVFEGVLNRLWLVMAATFVGGLLGLTYQWLQPPLYESYAIIELNIDLTMPNFSQRNPLDEREQDLAIGAAQALITSSTVFQDINAEITAYGLPADTEAFLLGERLFLERQQSLQILRVRDADPETAAKIANIWAEKAYSALAEAHSHALQARSLHEFREVLHQCVLQKQEEDPPPAKLCADISLEDIEQKLRDTNEEVEVEIAASKGIIPALRYDLSREAVVPNRPVAYNRIFLMLSGALIGFIGSATFTSFQERR